MPYTIADVQERGGDDVLTGFLRQAFTETGVLAPAAGIAFNVMGFGAKGDGTTDDTAAIQAAMTASAAVSGSIVSVPAGTYLITAQLLPGAGVTIAGAGLGSVIKKGFSGLIVRTNGANVTIRDLVFDGNQAGGFTNANVLVQSNDFTMTGCVLKNANTNGVSVTSASRALIANCRFSGNLQRDVFINPTAAGDGRDIKVKACYIDGSASSAAVSRITASPGAGGVADCNGFQLVGNTIIVGNNASAAALDIALGSGVASSGWIVGNNTVRLSANTALGLSFSGVGAGVCNGNTVDVNGFNLTTAAIEIASCTGVAVTGNTILGGTTLTCGIQCDGAAASSGHSITGNTINGLLSTALGGIRVIANSATSVYNDIVISGNNITWGGAGTGISGILVNTNNASAHADRILIFGNVVRGNGAATTVGVKLNNNAAGVIDKCFITGNILTNVITAISQTGDTNTLVPASTNQT